MYHQYSEHYTKGTGPGAEEGLCWGPGPFLEKPYLQAIADMLRYAFFHSP